MIPFKARRGEERGIEEFLQNPKFDFYKRGSGTKETTLPESFLNEIKRYQPFNYVTAKVSLNSNNSDNEPKIGHTRTYIYGDQPDRYPSLEEKAIGMKQPLLIDWDNPGDENVKKIVKSLGLEGKVDAVTVDATNRYSLFDLKDSDNN